MGEEEEKWSIVFITLIRTQFSYHFLPYNRTSLDLLLAETLSEVCMCSAWAHVTPWIVHRSCRVHHPMTKYANLVFWPMTLDSGVMRRSVFVCFWRQPTRERESERVRGGWGMKELDFCCWSNTQHSTHNVWHENNTTRWWIRKWKCWAKGWGFFGKRVECVRPSRLWLWKPTSFSPIISRDVLCVRFMLPHNLLTGSIVGATLHIRNAVIPSWTDVL